MTKKLQPSREIWRPPNWRSQLLLTLRVLGMSQIHSFHSKPSARLEAEQACIAANCQTRSPYQEALKHIPGD